MKKGGREGGEEKGRQDDEDVESERWMVSNERDETSRKVSKQVPGDEPNEDRQPAYLAAVFPT